MSGSVIKHLDSVDERNLRLSGILRAPATITVTPHAQRWLNSWSFPVSQEHAALLRQPMALRISRDSKHFLLLVDRPDSVSE